MDIRKRHSILWVFSILVLVFGLQSCTSPDRIIVPFQYDTSIVTDGTFSQVEWQKAKRMAVDPTTFLYLLHDNESMLVGIENQGTINRYVDLYIYNDAMGILNLHASMQLGERRLNGKWNDTIPVWNWDNNKDWLANTVKFKEQGNSDGLTFVERIQSYEGQEFRISKERIQGDTFKIRLEIKDFLGEAKDLVFPLESIRHDTATWATVSLSSTFLE